MSEPRYPEQSTDAFRISTSSLETYLKCGIRYFLERELGHRRATVPMAIGSAVAFAAKKDNERKIASDGASALGLREIVESGVSAYDQEIENVELTESKREVAEGRDDAAGASRCYGEDVSKWVKDVLWAERRIVAEVADGIELAGTPDCVTENYVRDTKTGQPWNAARAYASRQLTAYDLLYEAMLSRSPERLVIDSISKSHGRWGNQAFYSTRDEEDRTAFIDVLGRAKDGIEAGIALPAPESAWWCSKKWCGFHGNGCPIYK